MADGPTLPEATQAVFQGPLFWAKNSALPCSPPPSLCVVCLGTYLEHKVSGRERYPQITLTIEGLGWGQVPLHIPDSHTHIHFMFR